MTCTNRSRLVCPSEMSLLSLTINYDSFADGALKAVMKVTLKK